MVIMMTLHETSVLEVLLCLCVGAERGGDNGERNRRTSGISPRPWYERSRSNVSVFTLRSGTSELIERKIPSSGWMRMVIVLGAMPP